MKFLIFQNVHDVILLYQRTTDAFLLPKYLYAKISSCQVSTTEGQKTQPF